MKKSLFPGLLSGCLLFAASTTEADLVDPKDMPGPLKEVGFDQKLGDMLPLDVPFVDEQGREVVLGDLFREKPVVMVFVYYDCPMICPMVLNGVAKTLGVLEFNVDQEFDVVAVSIDPTETVEQARAAKRTTIKRYGRGQTAAGWHFLTGDEESIRRVTEAAGFRYAYVPENGEYAHASGLVVATPDGTLAKYFYGIDFAPKHVRLALVEASEHRIGTVVDQILLYCFRYDPELGKYTAVITRILRIAAVIFCLALALFFWINLRRDRAIAHHTAVLGAESR